MGNSSSKTTRAADLVVGLVAGVSSEERAGILARIRALPQQPVGVAIAIDKMTNLPEGHSVKDLLHTANGILIAAALEAERGVSSSDADAIQLSVASGEPYLVQGSGFRGMEGDIQFRPDPTTNPFYKSSPSSAFPSSALLSPPSFVPSSSQASQDYRRNLADFQNSRNPLSLKTDKELVTDLKAQIAEKEKQLSDASTDAITILDDRIRYKWASSVLNSPKEVVDRLGSIEPDFSTIVKFEESIIRLAGPKVKGLLARLNPWGDIVPQGTTPYMVGDLTDLYSGSPESMFDALGSSVSGLVKGGSEIVSNAWNRLEPYQKGLVGGAGAIGGGLLLGKLFGAFSQGKGSDVESVASQAEELDYDDIKGDVPVFNVSPDIGLRLRDLGKRFSERKEAGRWIHPMTGDPATFGPILDRMATPPIYITSEGDILRDDYGALYTGGFFKKLASGVKSLATKGLGGIAKLAGSAVGFINPKAGDAISKGGTMLSKLGDKVRVDQKVSDASEAVTEAKTALLESGANVDELTRLGVSPTMAASWAGADPSIVKNLVSSAHLQTSIPNYMTQYTPSQLQSQGQNTLQVISGSSTADWDKLAEGLPFVGDIAVMEGNPVVMGGWAALKLVGSSVTSWFAINVVGKLGTWFSKLFAKPNPAAVSAGVGTNLTVNVINKAKPAMAHLRNIVVAAAAAGTVGYVLDKYFTSKEEKDALKEKMGSDNYEEFKRLDEKVRGDGSEGLSDEEMMKYSTLLSVVSGQAGSTGTAGPLEMQLEADPNPENGSSVMELFKKYGPMLALIAAVIGGPKLVKWIWSKAKNLFSSRTDVALGDPDPEMRAFMQGGLKLRLPNIKKFLEDKKDVINKVATVVSALTAPKGSDATDAELAKNLNVPVGLVETGRKIAPKVMEEWKDKLGWQFNQQKPTEEILTNDRFIAPIQDELSRQTNTLNPQMSDAEWKSLDGGKVLDMNPDDSMMLVMSVQQPTVKKWVRFYKA